MGKAIQRLIIKQEIMEVKINNKVVKVEKYVSPYPIDLNTKNEIIRMQKANEDEIAYRWFTFDGKSYPITKVVVCGKPTWFIDGHPVMTIFDYTPYKITVQVKLARGGDWGNGERRKEYQAFVYNVMGILNSGQYPCFNDRTDDYFNEMSSIDGNGMHPFSLVK